MDGASPAQAVAAEHEKVRVLVSTLEWVIDAQRTQAEPLWRERLAAGLDAARVELASHFDHEERTGFFESVVLEHPEADRLCGRLAAEHPALLERLGGLAAETRGGAAPSTLVAGVRELLADVQRHEQTENQLLLDSVELPGVAAD